MGVSLGAGVAVDGDNGSSSVSGPVTVWFECEELGLAPIVRRLSTSMPMPILRGEVSIVISSTGGRLDVLVCAVYMDCCADRGDDKGEAEYGA